MFLIKKHTIVFLVILLSSTMASGEVGRGSSPEVIDGRYKRLWDSVKESPGGLPASIPSFIAHLGYRENNDFSIWVLLNDEGLRASERSWGVSCSVGNLQVSEVVYDKKFGTGLLKVGLIAGLQSGSKCTLSLNGTFDQEIAIPENTLFSNSERYSFSAFSCNEPFTTKHGGRILARDVSLWRRLGVRAAGEVSYADAIPKQTSLVLGLGDQVYVDPDPGGVDPLTFMEGTKSDQLLVDGCNSKDYNKDTCVSNLFEVFNTLYKYNFSAPHVRETLSNITSFMMWDDHEIRDGWGSHNDEMSDEWKRYFRVARHAFIANQYLRGLPLQAVDQESYDQLVSGNSPLHSSFNYGNHTHFLMLDSRSNRKSGDPMSLYDSSAKKAVKKWLSNSVETRGKVFVLTTGVPLFPSRRFENIKFSEYADDLRDGWGSDENIEARNALVRDIRDHFKQRPMDRLLVLSGDVHRSGVYLLSMDERVFGQEIITSGIAHAIPQKGVLANNLTNFSQEIEKVNVTPAGEISHSATFAEIIVDPNSGGMPPNLSLVFHANGTKVKSKTVPWVLANTHLLNRENSAKAWYHPYDFNYQDEFKHLAEKPKEAVGAGSIMDLPFGDIPKLKRHCKVLSLSRLVFWRDWVCSAIQAQSIFSNNPHQDFNTAPAESWGLEELMKGSSDLKKR